MCCIATDSFDCYFIFFFFNDTATTEIYTLSLHDALPILVRGERPVTEAGGHDQPRHAVRLQDEGLASAERIHAGRAGLRLRGGWLGRREVGHVVADPLLLGLVPPPPLLALAPRPALQIRRGAVVDDSAVSWPRVAPVELGAALVRRIGLPARRPILAGRRKDAAVDPGGACRRAVILEIAEGRHVPAGVVAVVAVDLLEELHGVRLAALAFPRVVVLVVEDEVLEALVARLLALGVELLEPPAGLVGEPDVGTAIPGRLGRLEVSLEHALSVGERALRFRHLRRREEENLGLDVLDLDVAVLDLGGVLPEGRALVEPVVLDHEPFELSHAGPLELGVERRGRVLTD